jgi:NAD(P)-dependent dehydrogenase (short-subunit alcohol dehydrogenase family)
VLLAGDIQNFTAGLAQLLAEKGIRANAVASGPIWTPLIPSTMSEEAIENFGKQVLRMKRPGQPAEPSPVWQCRHEAIGTFPDVGNKRPHLLVFARSH